MRAFFSFHGLNLVIETPYDNVFDQYSRSFRAFRVDEPTEGQPTLVYQVAPFDDPTGLHDVAPSRVGADGTLLWTPLPKVKLLIDGLTDRRTVIRQTRYHRRIYSDFLQVAIRMKFAQMDRTYQHCASITKDGNGVLLPAFGNVGKTTLSYKLFASGFDYMGDDETVFAPDGTIGAVPTELGLYYTTIKRNDIQLSDEQMREAFFKYLVSKVPQRFIYTSVKVHPEEILNPGVNPQTVTTSDAKLLFFLERGPNVVEEGDVDRIVKKMLSSTYYKQYEVARGLLYSYMSIDDDFDLVDIESQERDRLRESLSDVDCYRLQFNDFDFALEEIRSRV